MDGRLRLPSLIRAHYFTTSLNLLSILSSGQLAAGAFVRGVYTSLDGNSSSTTNGSQRHMMALTMETITTNLKKLCLELPPPGGPKANYSPLHRDGDLLYLSGHLPIKADGSMIVGVCAPASVVGSDSNFIGTDQGYEAARWCALNLLSTVNAYLSENSATSADLSNIKVVKLFGIVRSHDDFQEQHLVMNGASDLIKDVLGDSGACHARSAIGSNSLPLGIAVEVEMICKIVE